MSRRRSKPRSKQRSKRRSEKGWRRAHAGREWIGGVVSPPFFITDRDEPYRPGLVLWMDTSDGLIVGQQVVEPEAAQGAVADVLLDAIERPLAGPPRRPDRIRVADASIAGELRAALDDALPIDVAPTPELDELVAAMVESLPGDDVPESYLEQGRLAPEDVAELFAAAEVLYHLAPWRVVTDDQVLRMDIPALGVEGACVAVIGNLDESFGLLIFPSLAGYDAFGRAAEGWVPGSGRPDLGTGWLALSFEPGAQVPDAMRREIDAHGWPVADANGYPLLDHYESDGASRPLVERDLKIAAACARSFSAFYAKHRQVFSADEFEPICDSYFDEDELEVRFTLPYEAFELFEVEAPRPAPTEAPPVGRNQPCPCGSGRKYKRCHGRRRKSDRAPSTARAPEHARDERLLEELGAYATARFGDEWLRFERDFADPSRALPLAIPWSVHGYRVQGRTVREWYLHEQGRGLRKADRRWLAAQGAAWLSIWEVVGVEPGKTVTLRDLLSYEERCVREASGSQTLVERDAILARVVDQEGGALLCGVHPRTLPPIEVAEVVRRARGRLRRKRAVPVERLRDGAIGRYLIKRWEEAVGDLDLRALIPPELRNTDGDPFLLTTDHFGFEPGARGEVQERLAAIEGAELEDSEGGRSSYVFLAAGNRLHSSWENTVTGRAVLAKSWLRLDTNSRERADEFRAQVEEACGGLIQHRAREHADPMSQEAPTLPADSTNVPPEAEQLLLEFKQNHYDGWLDEPLPALGGKTPRESAATAQGRAAVDVLLKDMENHERRSAGASAFDFSPLRRELRLE
ncbi:MAG: hypothetical protein CL910_08305 [Deltaproteobacteria bacterium]|nr:hypothetical protein [Deltaproteobacteria bacterium]